MGALRVLTHRINKETRMYLNPQGNKQALQELEEKVLARLRAEGIDYHDEVAAIASLEQCVMPTVCVQAYKAWLKKEKTDDVQFHLGHEFSGGMPEIGMVKGRPLADLIEDHQPLSLSENEFLDEFEKALSQLTESDIEVVGSLPEGVTAVDHLEACWSGFVAQYDD